MDKNTLREIFKGCRVITVEDDAKRQVCIVSPQEANALIQKALKQGKTVIENGVSSWLEEEPVCDFDKKNTDIYTWDKTGNKILVQKILHTKDKTGTITKKVLSSVWKSYTAVFSV